MPRTGKIRIGGQTLTVNQAGRCPNINPLTVGSTPVSGQLSGTDCQSSSGGLADYYSFSGIAGQQIAINLNSTAFIPRLILYDPRGVREEYDDNFGGGSSASIPINGGFHTLWMTGTYTIAVTSSGGTGAYALRLRGAEGACTTIAPIEIAQSVTGQLSTTDCRLSIDNSFVDFYSFSGTAGQQIAINLNSSAFNAFLLLYDPDGNLIASDDNGGGGTNARIPAGSGFFTLPATGTYLVGANSFAAGQTGAYTLWLSSNCQGIATNPTDKVVCAGSNVSFTAAVSGPFTGVRWEESPPGCVRRFIDITGNPTATTTTLTLTGVTTARNGSRYRAVFTGMCGTATSAVATLTVNAATGIASQPSSQTVCAGAATSFSVTASGTGPFTYQWRKNGANIAGATGSSYSIASVTAANAGSYSVVVTGACGSATSNAATLTVNTPPNITTQPANQTVAAGGGVSFTAAAGGNPVPTVQWQVSTNSGVSFSNITGATSATLMLTNVNAALNGNRYRAVFTNSCNSATTTAATLTVTCPAITLSPTNPTLPAGRAGDQYSQTFTATGGTAPYVFSVSAGLLPPGLSLSSGGVFSGAPTGFGTFNFTIKATDVNDCMGARAYTLVINPPCPAITVNPSSLPNGAVGVGYNQTVSATGGTPPYTFTIISGGLPAGLTLSPAGVISGTPSSGGTFGFTIK
ncbi:MAG: immunoglobulin domain-containing protein, partial [Blastocatellia bacterium]